MACKDNIFVLHRCFHNFLFIGRNYTSFILVFHECPFSKGDRIRPVGTNYDIKVYQTRKISYLCNIIGTDPDVYLEEKYAKHGVKWEKII